MQNILSSTLLSKNVKIKIYRTIILPVDLYGCESWSLSVREECRLRIFENRVLRRIFGPKRDKGMEKPAQQGSSCPVLLTQYHWRDHIKNNGIGRAFGMHREGYRCTQNFNGDTWGKETTWKSEA